MLTGLVYAAVVTLWAVVLIPHWLRRHDRNATARTTVTFSRALATLSRRRSRSSVSRASHNIDVVVAGASGRVHDRVRECAAGSRGDEIDKHLDHGSDPFAGGDQEQHLLDARKARARMIARETAARRRRQVRQALIGVSVIVLVLYVMGAVPLGLMLLPPAGLAAMWYANLRIEARPRRRAGTQGGAATRRSAGPTRNAPARSARARSARRPAARHVEAGARIGAASSPTSSADVEILSDAEVAQRDAGVEGDRWDAVDPHRPRYASGRDESRRTGRRTASDWTARRMLEQVEALRNPADDIDAELGLDDLVHVPDEHRFERRRAANE